MKNIVGLSLFVLVLLAGCQGEDQNTAAANGAGINHSEFVTVEGRQFFWRGEPYYVIGTNMWYGAYLGAPGELGDRQRLRKELDLLKQTGINNLRVLAVSEASELVRAVRPAVIPAPGEYNENLLIGLDFLLDEMAQRDMHAVLYFNNFWQWSGGMSQYVSWFTGEPVLDPDVTNEWNAFMQNSADFYRIKDAQRLYRDVIKKIVTRQNTVNGKMYNEDPVIMSWQLANEPRPGNDVEGRENFSIFKNWIHETAQYIRTLAPRQLISTGNEGAMGVVGDLDLFVEAHASPFIDYLTFHMWLKNWGWFDAVSPDATYDSALASAKKYINDHIDVANQLNKPIVLEEFGVERDGGAFELSAGTSYRDRFYREFFSLIEARTAAGEAIGGSNFWAWGGYGRTTNTDFMWREGDDFVGDPPQEPQGLNSIFDSDTSTLEIIKQHSRVMHSLATIEAR